MKNRLIQIFILTLFILMGNNAYSQKFYGGLHAGINGSQIWGDQMRGFNKGGLLAGVFIDYPYSDKVFFTMELNYTQKGSRRIYDETNSGSGLWNLLRISYLEVPLLINYRLSEKVDLNIGLSYGIKAGAKYVDLNGVEGMDSNFLRTSDFGICGGGNYLLGKKFKLTLRAGASLITIGTGKSNPIWAKTNTGMINIITTCAIKYYFLSPNK